MATAEHSMVKAAFWMGGWLLAMVTMAVAGREAASQLNAFQVMEMRTMLSIKLLLQQLAKVHF